MTDFTVAIYCFIDDLLQKIEKNISTDSRRKLTDAQVITTVIISAKFFYGNQHAACVYMREHWGFTMPDKSNFNRILHKLSDLIIAIFYQLSSIFKYLNLESVYIIDSFPVQVCKNIRIRRSKIVKGESFRGYNASKREYFYGFKVHMICTGQGIAVDFMITPASTHDNKALQMMNINLPPKSDLYADSAYLNAEIKDLLEEYEEIKLKVATKKNSLQRNTWAEELENKYYRKTIENTFAEINAIFPKKIHAVTAKGFLLKLLITIITSILNKSFKII
jgi:hypothetical protein